MAQYRIDKNDLKQVQINLIRSHCTGTGDILSPKEVRGVMTVRLNTFVQGYSGIHTDVIEILQKFPGCGLRPDAADGADHPGPGGGDAQLH